MNTTEYMLEISSRLIAKLDEELGVVKKQFEQLEIKHAELEDERNRLARRVNALLEQVRKMGLGRTKENYMRS